MSEFEEVTTGLGEECGVFGAYDMDGPFQKRIGTCQ